MRISKIVRLANDASAQDIQSHLTSTYTYPDWIASLKAQHASTLDEAQRRLVWVMFETNMYTLYVKSSFGWDPNAKRQELFDPLSRFILIYSENKGELIAFVMFRFEMEKDENVIYCYDIQVDSSMQGKGLGRKLLDELSTLRKIYKMQKVMLTVLRANIRAFALYQKIGFVIDPSSPGYITDEERRKGIVVDATDYEIMSRGI